MILYKRSRTNERRRKISGGGGGGGWVGGGGLKKCFFYYPEGLLLQIATAASFILFSVKTQTYQKHLAHFMINVQYTLEFSQCSQGRLV